MKDWQVCVIVICLTAINLSLLQINSNISEITSAIRRHDCGDVAVELKTINKTLKETNNDQWRIQCEQMNMLEKQLKSIDAKLGAAK